MRRVAIVAVGETIQKAEAGDAVEAGGDRGHTDDTETFIDISNVMLVCNSCGKTTRVGYRVEADGTKVRVCKRCGADQ